MSFFTVDRNVFSSSIWLSGTPEERCLWWWLLGNKDDDGVVRHRELAIADGAKLPRAMVEAALEKFSKPDPDSRTKDNDGRRIDRTPDGFVRILNHELYYSKDYSTPRWRKWKDRQRANALANAQTPLANAPTPLPTKDKDKDKDKDITETDPPPTPSGGGGQAAAGGASGNGSGHETRSRANRTSKPSAEASAVAARFVLAFNATYGRRVTALPALLADVAARLGAGYSADQLVAVPILTDAQGLPADLRASLQPRWLLRVGAHPRAGADGRVNGGKDWIGSALDRADRTRLWPRHVEAAQAAGVLDALRQLGARLADPDQEAIA